MVLDRNPSNYFAEVEQIAFAPSHMVPGIEPSPDKMLQGIYTYIIIFDSSFQHNMIRIATKNIFIVMIFMVILPVSSVRSIVQLCGHASPSPGSELPEHPGELPFRLSGCELSARR